MNRDNGMFLVIGLLSGFIAGYLIHESVAARQPPRLPVGGVAAMPPGAPGVPAGGAPGVPGGSGPMNQEVARLKAHVEQNPNDADAVLALANLNFDVQNWGNAKTLYEHYLTLRDATPDVLTDLGVCWRELRDFPKAIELFDRAQAIEPSHWQSRYNEVIVLTFDLNQLDRAAQAIAELEDLQPGNQDVQRLAAEIERRRAAA